MLAKSLSTAPSATTNALIRPMSALSNAPETQWIIPGIFRTVSDAGILPIEFNIPALVAITIFAPVAAVGLPCSVLV
jgi:hypothetical protein